MKPHKISDILFFGDVESPSDTEIQLYSPQGETQKRRIPLKNVFDAVVKTAKESGLTVELQSERIVFITNKDTIK